MKLSTNEEGDTTIQLEPDEHLYVQITGAEVALYGGYLAGMRVMSEPHVTILPEQGHTVQLTQGMQESGAIILNANILREAKEEANT